MSNQKIGLFRLRNDGGFVAKMQILYRVGNTEEKKTDETGDILLGQTHDMKPGDKIPNGAEIQLRVNVLAGSSIAANEKFIYDSTSKVAAEYVIAGTTITESLGFVKLGEEAITGEERVRMFRLRNEGGFVAKMQIFYWGGGPDIKKTGETAGIPLGQSLDMNPENYGVPDDTPVQLNVNVILGKSHIADRKFIYDRHSDITAEYVITGTTLNNSLGLAKLAHDQLVL